MRMWDPRRWPLGVKFGVALVLVALLPLALLANITLNAGRTAVEQAQLRTAQGAAVVSSAAVRQYLSGVAARADQIATRTDVVRFALDSQGEERPELAGELTADDVLAVALYSPAGDPILVETDVDSGLADRNVADQTWFTDGVAGKPTIGGLDVDGRTGLLTAIVAAPIRFPGSGSVGVAALQVRGSSVLFALNQAPLVAGGQALLVSGNGRIQSARDSRVIGQPLSTFRAGKLATAIATDVDGSIAGIPWTGRGPQVAAWSAIDNNLTSVILQPQGTFLRPIEELARTTWILFAIVAIVAFGLALLIARRLSRPINVLTRSAVHIDAGQDVDQEALAKIGAARDDVGRLARVFSSMAEQVARRERALREELRALRVEINQERRQEAVSEVTDTDFFRDLLVRAEEFRRRARHQDEEESR
jgi:HAMP domain-containing protein